MTISNWCTIVGLTCALMMASLKSGVPALAFGVAALALAVADYEGGSRTAAMGSVLWAICFCVGYSLSSGSEGTADPKSLER